MAKRVGKYKITKRPLYQLLQFGSFPPHYTYFSEMGLIKSISNFNYKLVEKQSDLDYEILFFGQRLSLKGLSKFIVNLFVSPILSILALITGTQDSMILLFKKD